MSFSQFCLFCQKRGIFLSTRISCNHDEEFKASPAQISKDMSYPEKFRVLLIIFQLWEVFTPACTLVT